MAEADLLPGSGDCSQLSRRAFVKTLGSAALATSVLPDGRPHAMAAPPAETAVGLFYKSLSEEQRRLKVRAVPRTGAWHASR